MRRKLVSISFIVSGMVTCGEQRLFSALFSSAEKISILSTGDTRAEIACSAGVFWAGDSLFNYVCIVVAIIAAPRRLLEWGI